MEKGGNEADASPLNPRGADKLCSAGGRGPDKPVTQVPPTTGYRQAVPVGGGPDKPEGMKSAQELRLVDGESARTTDTELVGLTWEAAATSRKELRISRNTGKIADKPQFGEKGRISRPPHTGANTRTYITLDGGLNIGDGPGQAGPGAYLFSCRALLEEVSAGFYWCAHR